MTMPWFRVYSEILDDRKIKRICKETGQAKALVIGTWVSLLALANNSPARGVLMLTEDTPYTVDDLADETGNVTETLHDLLRAFHDLGMIACDENFENIEVRNWEKRQFKSDNSTERVRKHREIYKKPDDETLQERYGNALDTDTDTELKERGAVAPPPPIEPPKRKTRTSDPRSKHPAILCVKGITGKYPPLEIYDDVIRALGNSPDGPKLAACRKEWITRGHNGQNWAWLLEWYVSGIPGRAINNGKLGPPPKTDDDFREVY